MKTTAKMTIKLLRGDIIQVWRDSSVGQETTISTRKKHQYDRIVKACDSALYPKRKWVNPYLNALSKVK